jgi:hypothetical protein
MRAVVLCALSILSVVTGCSQRHPVLIAAPPPALPPAPIQRTLIDTPPPALLPEPPLSALKPGTELSLAKSEALADQASPKAPLETQFTAGQRAIVRAEAEGHTTNPPATSAEGPQHRELRGKVLARRLGVGTIVPLGKRRQGKGH